MAEKTLGLKDGEESPKDTGQSKKETSEDLTPSVEFDIKETDEEGNVVVPKEQLDKFLKDRENYRKGMLKAQEKLRGVQSSLQEEEKEEPKESEFLTRSEFLKANEKQAIRRACKDPDVDENWDKVMEYYHPKHGRDTVDGIMTDIERAYKLFRLENPKEEDKGRKVESDLSAEKGKPSSSKSKKEGEKGKTTKGKRNLFPNSSTPDEWY